MPIDRGERFAFASIALQARAETFADGGKLLVTSDRMRHEGG